MLFPSSPELAGGSEKSEISVVTEAVVLEDRGEEAAKVVVKTEVAVVEGVAVGAERTTDGPPLVGAIAFAGRVVMVAVGAVEGATVRTGAAVDPGEGVAVDPGMVTVALVVGGAVVDAVPVAPAAAEVAPGTNTD